MASGVAFGFCSRSGNGQSARATAVAVPKHQRAGPPRDHAVSFGLLLRRNGESLRVGDHAAIVVHVGLPEPGLVSGTDRMSVGRYH
jgi:hypothetical protein